MPRIVPTWFPGANLNHLLYPDGPLDSWTLERYEARVDLPARGSGDVVPVTAAEFGLPCFQHHRLVRLRVYPWDGG